MKIVEVTMPKISPPIGGNTSKTKCVNTSQLAPVNAITTRAPVIKINK